MLSWHIYTYKNLNNIRRNEVWVWDLYHSTALVEVAKKSSTLECTRMWQSTIPETSAKVYGAWHNYTRMY